MAPEVDLIAIARDIAQESCYRIPVARPEWIAQRHYIFDAARAVKEMCKAANGDEEVANLVLFGAIAVEYAANFLAKNSMSERRRVLDNLEEIKDILRIMSSGEEDDVEIEAYVNGLIDALADDLQVDRGEISQSIESSLELHISGPQEAQGFIQDNPNWDFRNPDHVANLRQFLRDNAVSLLALRNERAVQFLDILEQAVRSEATPDDKRLYQTYLRRLSYRSKKLPSTFHLRDVEITYCEHIQCVHSSLGGPQQSLVGGNGKVCRAKWTKPGGTVVEVAVKDLRDREKMLCHDAAFWYYLDHDRMIPFYGVAVVDKSSRHVSLWMDGGRICCYVDGKSDSIRLDLLRQVAEGIKYLHDLNFVHGDIKPENILIDTHQSVPKALITDFGFSNAARRMNVEYSRSWSFTPGDVMDRNDITPWDPTNDVHAFGVTCCQVVLVNRRQDIASVPVDIKTCQLPLGSENSNGEGIMDDPHQISQRLRRKFFPVKKRQPSPFIKEIFDLVANTCIPTCKMDDVFSLLEKADVTLLTVQLTQTSLSVDS